MTAAPTVAAVVAPARRPIRARTVALVVFLVCAFCGFVALGVWQVQRMHWKDALIARVESRIHAAPVPPPQRAAWADVTEARDGYRRVRLTGVYLPVPETNTLAVTELGAGAWSLAPLRTADGDIVFVNRGFVPTGETASPLPTRPVEVIGLLRMTEPVGGFLRRNDPAAERWYSRDVAAIAQHRGLPAADVAPFFVDAAAAPDAAGWPRGGMTVVRFRDSHLIYALTWFGMALLTVAAAAALLVSSRRLRQDGRDASPP